MTASARVYPVAFSLERFPCCFALQWCTSSFLFIMAAILYQTNGSSDMSVNFFTGSALSLNNFQQTGITLAVKAANFATALIWNRIHNETVEQITTSHGMHGLMEPQV